MFVSQNFFSIIFFKKTLQSVSRWVILVKPQKYLAMIKISPNMAAKLV